MSTMSLAITRDPADFHIIPEQGTRSRRASVIVTQVHVRRTRSEPHAINKSPAGRAPAASQRPTLPCR